jgi:hypothetical protein
MTRKTRTEFASQETTKTIEVETAETVEQEVELVACDVCDRAVEADDVDDPDADVEMHTILRRDDVESSLSTVGQPSGAMVTGVAPAEVHIDDIREFKRILSFYVERTARDFEEISGIGGGSGYAVSKTSHSTQLDPIGVEEGLLGATDPTRAGLNRSDDIHVQLDLSPWLNDLPPSGKHVCEYCWEQLFGGDFDSES